MTFYSDVLTGFKVLGTNEKGKRPERETRRAEAVQTDVQRTPSCDVDIQRQSDKENELVKMTPVQSSYECFTDAF